FSGMLLRKYGNPYAAKPDKKLLKSFVEFCGRHVIEAACATVSSLKIESQYLPFFKSRDIIALDMECSAVFTAARETGMRAIALMYATDVLGGHPCLYSASPKDKQALKTSAEKAAQLICSFIKTRLHC
ncbi:MAG: hypothetical protein ABH885_01200, partial [Candidatus Omnitrophota bacterium]